MHSCLGWTVYKMKQNGSLAWMRTNHPLKCHLFQRWSTALLPMFVTFAYFVHKSNCLLLLCRLSSDYLVSYNTQQVLQACLFIQRSSGRYVALVGDWVQFLIINRYFNFTFSNTLLYTKSNRILFITQLEIF